jgi:hypothetical protein
METMHDHIIQQILTVVLERLPGQDIHLLTGPLSPADSFDILPNIFSRPFHQAIKQVPYHHSEKSLDRSRDQGRAKLKEKEVDELVQGPGIARFHASSPEVVFDKTEDRFMNRPRGVLESAQDVGGMGLEEIDSRQTSF